MAKDEKGLQPIVEILSAIIKPEHKPFTPIQEHRETGKPPLENLSTPSPRVPHRLPPSRC